MKDGSTDLHSNKEGDLCELVGTNSNGRKIWRWIGPETTTSAPVEIIFTNHDLLTDIMSFENGGYYNYDRLLYKAGLATGITATNNTAINDDAWYDLTGRKLIGSPTTKGIYIHQGKKYIKTIDR